MSKKSVFSLFLVLSCSLVPRQADSQEQRSTDSPEHRSGIVSSVDTDRHLIAIRMKSSTNPDKEMVYTLRISPDAKVSKADGTSAKFSDLKEGSVVEWSGKEGESRVNAIKLQPACTPDTCARSSCNKTCHSEACRCPKLK
jgi:hypothetical protein